MINASSFQQDLCYEQSDGKENMSIDTDIP